MDVAVDNGRIYMQGCNMSATHPANIGRLPETGSMLQGKPTIWSIFAGRMFSEIPIQDTTPAHLRNAETKQIKGKPGQTRPSRNHPFPMKASTPVFRPSTPPPPHPPGQPSQCPDPKDCKPFRFSKRFYIYLSKLKTPLNRCPSPADRSLRMS